jgi:uncharacterized surface protein with fasciclin (FAS1) repeats
MREKIKIVALLCVLLGPATLASAQNGSSPAGSAGQSTARASGTLAQLVASDPRFSKLKAALQAADMTAVLETPGPFTVFAPTDAAFNKLQGENKMEDLLKIENKDRLLSILRYHIVPGRVNGTQLQSTKTLKTVETQELAVRRANNQVTVNGVRVNQPALAASNGVIYVVDKVLVPDDNEGQMGNSSGARKDK